MSFAFMDVVILVNRNSLQGIQHSISPRAKLNLNISLVDEDLEYLNNYSNFIDLYNGTFPKQNSSIDLPMCTLEQLKVGYHPLHGYLSMVVCVLGTLFNALNILVLTHKDMRSNPINLILTGIAVADVLVMLEYIPFIIHNNLLEGRALEDRLSWYWGIFMWFHVNFTITIHNVSIWITLSLAIWRYIMIRHHVAAVSLCTIPRCKILLLLGYIVPVLLTIPNMMAMMIKETYHMNEEGRNVTTYTIQFLEEKEGDRLLYRITVWFYSFFLKLVPCVVLTIFTGFLIRALYQAEENSNRIKNGASYRSASRDIQRDDKNIENGGATTVADGIPVPLSASVQNNPMTRRNSKIPVASRSSNQSNKKRRGRNTDRTTRLLIVILLLFLLTEFPQGILGVLSAVFGEQFFMDCYSPLGEMMDIMALLNCSINFVLFCIMSIQFRKTFHKVLGTKQIINKYFASSPERGNTEAIPLNTLNN